MGLCVYGRSIKSRLHPSSCCQCIAFWEFLFGRMGLDLPHLVPSHLPLHLGRSWTWNGRQSSWCTQSPRMWSSCPRGCPEMLPATTSSSTSTPMRVTPSSLWVSGHSRAPTPVAGRSRSGPQLVGLLQGAWVSRFPRLTSPSPTVFIYSMPGYKCSIKERMLYSSCKSRLLDSVEQDFQLEISKKVGTHSPAPHLPGPCRPTLHVGHWSPESMAG